jgi:hypothetical protein
MEGKSSLSDIPTHPSDSIQTVSVFVRSAVGVVLGLAVRLTNTFTGKEYGIRAS